MTIAVLKRLPLAAVVATLALIVGWWLAPILFTVALLAAANEALIAASRVARAGNDLADIEAGAQFTAALRRDMSEFDDAPTPRHAAGAWQSQETETGRRWVPVPLRPSWRIRAAGFLRPYVTDARWFLARHERTFWTEHDAPEVAYEPRHGDSWNIDTAALTQFMAEAEAAEQRRLDRHIEALVLASALRTGAMR